MTRTATRPIVPIHSSSIHEWAALAISALAAVTIGIIVVDGPARVDHITIVNPTDYRLYISARTPDDSSLSQVGIIGPQRIKTFDGILDRGDVWVLDLRAQGSQAVNIEVSRDALTSTTPYTVPFDVDQRLKDSGIATTSGAS